MKKSFVGQHILRTIHNNLNIPNITYDWKKSIQLLRHEYSRKRSCLFDNEQRMKKKRYGGEEEDKRYGGEEEDISEILSAARMKELLGKNGTSRMEGHLEDVQKHYRKVFPKPNKQKCFQKQISKHKFTIEMAQKRLKEIEELDKRKRKKLKIG